MHSSPLFAFIRSTLILGAACLLLADLLAGTVFTGFTPGAPEDADGYPGARGAGWAHAWHKGILPGPEVTAEVRSDVPLGDGGSYLRIAFNGTKVDSGVGRSFTRGVGPASVDGAAKVVFEFKIRLEKETRGFSSSSDRVTLQNNDRGLVSSSNGSTWIISTAGGPQGSRGSAMQWLLYNGGRNAGGYDEDAWVSSGMPLIPGAVYAFRIVADPLALSYDVEIESGGVVVNRQGLGFRTNAKRVGNTFGIFAHSDQRDDRIIVSMDDLSISNDLRRRGPQK